MAWYKYKEYLNHFAGSGDAYDQIFKPGAQPHHSGIYRCMGCGREAVAESSRQLPPPPHHQHTTGQGEIRWRLAVFAHNEPS